LPLTADLGNAADRSAHVRRRAVLHRRVAGLVTLKLRDDMIRKEKGRPVGMIGVFLNLALNGG
jgi:hypothetical protein